MRRGCERDTRHKNEVERFIASYEGTDDLVEKMKFFPVMWEERILVVDSEDMITMALQAILEGEGEVDSARNGEDGLRKLSMNDYGAVITDMYIRGIDGLEFYRKAVELHPKLRGRFLFFIREDDREHIDFMNENRLKYLPKPSNVNLIRNAVSEILRG